MLLNIFCCPCVCVHTAQPDIAGLFGATPSSLPSSKIAGGVSAQNWNTAEQVFPTAQFQTLFAKLQTAVNAGAAPVIDITLPVSLRSCKLEAQMTYIASLIKAHNAA